MTNLNYAKDGYAFMRVMTPSVAREYELPVRGELRGIDRKRYDELRDLAERHGASIESNPYQTL